YINREIFTSVLGGFTVVQNRGGFVESVGKPKLHLLKRHWLLLFTACLVLLFPSQSVFAALTTNLQTVYHVYLDDTHIGTVSTKDVVDEIIDKKIEAYQKEYSNVTLTAGENISYIEEKSFHPNYNEDEVRHKLSEDIEVKADAYALKVRSEEHTSELQSRFDLVC